WLVSSSEQPGRSGRDPRTVCASVKPSTWERRLSGGIAMFSPEVIEKLQHYVYRLIDPRNGETFYVGKGVGNRVFEHARGERGLSEDAELSEKLTRIRRIRRDGFEVAHVIHRHGLGQETAFEVEAALIDAYP